MHRLVLAALLATLAAPAAARQPKAYQVTGEIVEVGDNLIVVMKGKEKFEIARTPETKVTGGAREGRQSHRRISDDRHHRRGEGGHCRRQGLEEEVSWRAPGGSPSVKKGYHARLAC